MWIYNEDTLCAPYFTDTLGAACIYVLYCFDLTSVQFNSASNASFKSAKVTMKHSKMLKSKSPWHGESDKRTPIAEVL